MIEREKVVVKLHDMAFGGEAVGRIDNQVIFVSHGLPGEVVEVEIYSAKKDFLRGRVTRVIEPSPDRIEPRCKYFGRCGGCQWQHVSYEKQLEMKRQVVVDQLARLGKLPEVPVRPTIGSESPWHYRNHARFSVGKREGEVGFTWAGSRRLLPIDRCELMDPTINEVLASVQGKLTDVRRRRLHQLAVRQGVNTGQTLINPKLEVENFPFESGQEHLEERLLDRTFRVSGSAFFQVNTLQAEVMARTIAEMLDPSPDDTVIDAYCGVGTFGLLLANRVKRVIAIEESAAAIKDGTYNAQGLNNVQFVLGATEKKLPEVAEPGSLVILDPPRLGCRPEVIETLAKVQPRKIVYVSCDPATLARDLRLLTDAGFSVRYVQPVDMFPQTYHIECLALITDGKDEANELA